MIEKLSSIFILSLVFTSYLVEAGFTQENIKEVGKRCNAIESDLDVALKYEVPDTSSGKCLMTCMLKELSTLKPDGLYVRDSALEALKKHWPEIDAKKLETLADECETAVKGQEELAKSEPCEYGHKIAVCLNKYFKTLLPGVLPVPQKE